MDSDAKELGHVRAASSKDRLGLLSAECDHTVLLASATVISIENLPMTRALICVRNRPHESAIEQASVESKRISGLRAIQKRRATTSGLGQKATFPRLQGVSALLLKASSFFMSTRPRVQSRSNWLKFRELQQPGVPRDILCRVVSELLRPLGDGIDADLGEAPFGVELFYRSVEHVIQRCDNCRG